MSEEFEIKGPSVSGAPIVFFNNEKDDSINEVNTSQEFEIKPPSNTNENKESNKSYLNLFDLITPTATTAAAGFATGLAERRFPQKESSSAVINEIKKLAASGNIDEALRLSQIEFGGGISKMTDVNDLQGRASGPKIEGASGVRNWTIAEAGQRHQMPEAILDIATDKTKDSPTGGKRLIEQDLINQEKIKRLGYGNYELSGRGPGQLQLPNEYSAKAAPSTRPDFSKQIKEIEELIFRGRKAEAISRLSGLFGGGPFKGALMGGLGGLQLAGAAQAAKAGDIPTAAIQGVGGLGSLASLIPKVAPRLIGGAAGLASIPAQFMYEAYKGIPKEQMENVAARKKFESLGAPTPEEIAFYERMRPATSR
jgi:hypothetical protein